MHTYFSDESSLQKRDCKDNKTCQTWTILQDQQFSTRICKNRILAFEILIKKSTNV